MQQESFIISENKKVIANITINITRKGRTFFLVFIKKKISTIVKIKDNHPDIESERNHAITDITTKAPNIIRTHKVTLAINIPIRTGMIKLT